MSEDGAPGSTGLRGRRTEPERRAVIALHVLAAVAVLATAAMARLPFVPAYDVLDRRPTWTGLVSAWLVIGAVYLLGWWRVSRGSRVAELFVFVALLLSAVWAVAIVLISALQASGVSPSSVRFSTVWTLRLVTALAVLGGLAAASRARSIQPDDVDESDQFGHHNSIRLPLSFGRFAAAVLGVAVVGLLLNAFSLALLAPPKATPEQAAAAVGAAAAGVRTDGLLQFQADLTDVVETRAQTQPRDRWELVEGILDAGSAARYASDVQWATQVTYREQMVCVAAGVQDGELAAVPGVCPR